MHREYTTLCSRAPRSFIFAVVANVGPGGASRSLAVAYRQHHDDVYNTNASWPRVHHMITDTLALVEILSDPANRALLEAERALAEDWYRQSPVEPPIHERPSVPDTAQPSYNPWNRHRDPIQQQPSLPWRDDTIRQFPFTATCVLLALLRDDCDATRPDDIQFQPLSTVFRADCTEYGLVILDISDLNSSVKYGIAAFPVDYMAEVLSRGKFFDWDPVEDPQPEKEPDIILRSPRPRVLLSITQWVGKYYNWLDMEGQPSISQLDKRPLVDAAALDYIWPPQMEPPARASSPDVLSRILKFFRPSKKVRSTSRSMEGYTIVDKPPQDMSIGHIKDDSTTRASSVTVSDKPLQAVPVDIDRTIDDLLVLTQEPANPLLEKQALAYLQILAPFREKLRQRLKEVPNKLGPSILSSQVLYTAYTECSHLNWAVFRNLPPRVIAAAIISDDLQDASALSLNENIFQLARDKEEGESDLIDLTAALAHTALQQLCFVLQPDQNYNNTSDDFNPQLLRLWGPILSDKDWEWLRLKTIHSTSMFLAGLRSRKFLTSPSMRGLDSGFTSSGAPIVPMIHLFTFEGPQREDVPNAAVDHVLRARPGYSSYYSMDNTGLNAESFAVRFLAYLRALGPDSDLDKAILRFAYHGAFSSLASIDDNYNNSNLLLPPPRPPRPPPLQSWPDRLGVRPIPAGFFDKLAPNGSSRTRLRDIQPGSWVILIDRDRSCRSSDNDAFLQYSFVRIRQPSAEVAPGQQSSSVEVVGGLTDFLRETVPEIDLTMWEKRVQEVEKDLLSAFTRPSPPSTPSSIDFATGEERANESYRRLALASTGMSAPSTPSTITIPIGEEPPVVEVERESCMDVRVMAESWAHTLLDQVL